VLRAPQPLGLLGLLGLLLLPFLLRQLLRPLLLLHVRAVRLRLQWSNPAAKQHVHRSRQLHKWQAALAAAATQGGGGRSLLQAARQHVKVSPGSEDLDYASTPQQSLLVQQLQVAVTKAAAHMQGCPGLP
jgi:hypothetical protein